ncbi:MAG: polysaccharide deacetylase family protein [Candidatus Nomurabacteria bacterium]|jgi:peptidoglycan/xylan/chitin deacetylase (PgdA/CDA1 family)|nr:polysaccharide deacetylase family protein [Candidatus Nomurabacteria bacterium]
MIGYGRYRGYQVGRDYKKAHRKKTVIILAIAAALVLCGASLAGWLMHGRKAPSIHSETLAGIDIETIVELNDTQIAVHYPRTKNDAVNQVLHDFATTTVSDFKRDVVNYPHSRDELNMSFKTYRYSEDIVSFAFTKYTIHDWQANGEDSLATMTFNLKTGQQYQIGDVLVGQYLDALSGRIFNHLKNKAEFRDEAQRAALRDGLAPDANNFRNFVLDANKITFLFGPYQLGARDVPEQKVSFKLSDLKSYLAEPFRTAPPPLPQPAAPPAAAQPKPVDTGDLNGKKLVALTFDDGPHPTNTNVLLDTLRREKVNATFFVLGSRVEYYGDVVRRAYEQGNQIASHTTNHKSLTGLSPAERQFEINSTITAIEKTIGVRPTVMRPPYGAFDDAVRADAGMPLVLWSVDPEDWRYLNADTVYGNVMSHVADGSIVLLHDIHATSVQAAARIIPDLKSQGYTLVTIDQLIKTRGGDYTPGRVYYSM